MKSRCIPDALYMYTGPVNSDRVGQRYLEIIKNEVPWYIFHFDQNFGACATTQSRPSFRFNISIKKSVYLFIFYAGFDRVNVCKMSRDYDHLFKLLIIGDSGKLKMPWPLTRSFSNLCSSSCSKSRILFFFLIHCRSIVILVLV